MKTVNADPKRLTREEAWRLLPALPEYLWHILRMQASARLQEVYAGTGEGIGTSDINHEIVNIITSGEDCLPGIKTLRYYLPELKKSKKN